MTSCKLLAAAVLLALSTACVGGAQYMIGKDQKPSIASKSDMAVLAIVRTTSFGFAVVIDNYFDGKMIGQTRGKSSFLTLVPAGRHYVMGKAENISTARLDFEPGKVYFLNQFITPGFWKARTGFAPMTGDEGMKEFTESGNDYREYDFAHPGPDLEAADFKEARDDFEKETKEDPGRHRDILEYKGASR